MPVRAHAPLLSATCPVTGLAGPGARDCPQERGVSRSCEGSFDQRVSEAAPATVGGFSMATVASPWEDRVRADRQTDRKAITTLQLGAGVSRVSMRQRRAWRAGASWSRGRGAEARHVTA